MYLLVQRIASTAISPSAAQGQGPPRTMECAERFLYERDFLQSFSAVHNATSFCDILNEKTCELCDRLPSGVRKNGSPYGKHWGSARKFINIFLLECTLNRYLSSYYVNLLKLEPWLEVPLDSFVGNGLAKEKENLESQSPVYWNTIIGLSRDDSDRYQELAQKVADRMHMLRVHLDLYYLAFEKPVLEG